MAKRAAVSKTRALIAQRFMALRIAGGLRPYDVYRALEIPPTTFRDIEAGRMLPNIITIGRLCAFYDAPVDFILTGTGLNRELKMPREAEVMLKHIMTPIDLHEPRPAGKAGFLTLRVAELPPVEFDLKRILLRSPAAEILAAAESVEQARPSVEPPVGNFMQLKSHPIPKSAKKPAKKSVKKAKPNLKAAGLLDI